MVGRRKLILAVAAGLAGAGGLTLPCAAAPAHGGLGPIRPPVPPPPLVLTLHNGQRHALQALLRGRITALQLMFTSCSATCPLQGAIFAALQRRMASTTTTATKTGLPLDDRPGQSQLLSISIQPLVDDAAALAAWRLRFDAGARWLTGAPPPQKADLMLEFLGAGSGNPHDRHIAQTYLFDTQGRLAFRLAPLAGADAIHDAVQGLAASSAGG